MSIWKKPKSAKIDKPWGYEHVIGSPFSMGAKVINLRADCRTSLKYYQNLNQLIFVYDGKVMVHAPNEKEFGDIKTDQCNYFELNVGDSLLIQAENPYRIEALQDSVLIEVLGGRRHFDNDAVMLEDDYGRVDTNKDTSGEKND